MCIRDRCNEIYQKIENDNRGFAVSFIALLSLVLTKGMDQQWRKRPTPSIDSYSFLLLKTVYKFFKNVYQLSGTNTFDIKTAAHHCQSVQVGDSIKVDVDVTINETL